MDKYKLVPVEPTPEMASEGARFLQIMSLPEREAVSVFRAMLAAAPTIQGEPVAWMHSDPGRVDVIHDKVRKLLKDSSDNAGYLHRPLDKSERYTIPLYTAPQPAEQQPSPDVTGLVEALEDINQWTSRWVSADHPVAKAARKALAAYRKQGEE